MTVLGPSFVTVTSLTVGYSIPPTNALESLAGTHSLFGPSLKTVVVFFGYALPPTGYQDLANLLLRIVSLSTNVRHLELHLPTSYYPEEADVLQALLDAKHMQISSLRHLVFVSSFCRHIFNLQAFITCHLENLQRIDLFMDALWSMNLSFIQSLRSLQYFNGTADQVISVDSRPWAGYDYESVAEVLEACPHLTDFDCLVEAALTTSSEALLAVYSAVFQALRHLQSFTIRSFYILDIADVEWAVENENSLWTFKNVSQHPEVLTRHAALNKEVSVFDAVLGNIIEGDIAVLTPNANALYYPPRICRVRLRSDYHYATDDPVYYPQPFDPQAPHLALMLTPTRALNDPYSLAWIIPTSDDFKTTWESDKLVVGHFMNSYINSLRKVASLALSEISPDHTDGFLKEAASSLDQQVEFLAQGGTKKVLFARAAIIRRLSLEINARVCWLSAKWQQRFSDAKYRKKAQVANVMGAFTENLEEADLLFHMGIPVWRVTQKDRLPPMQRIDHVPPVIKEDSFGMLFCSDGFMVDCRDADPPHKIIYEGFPRKPEHYLSIASYMQSLVGLGEDETTMGSKWPHSTLAVSKAAGLTPSILRDATVTASPRMSPYVRSSRKHRPTPPKKNPFIVISRPTVPPALESWEQALKLLADYNQSYKPLVQVDSRFFLPPIRKITSSSNPQVIAKLIFGWLCICPMVLSKLSLQSSSDHRGASTGQPSCEREDHEWRAGSKEWRCLLEIASGIYDEAKDQDAVSSRRHLEMKSQLENLLEESKECDIERISE
ncbi:hypothetical protein GYMLUDRAFT_248823 [Collybiopsis luxurians FD-317 M1]|uniref:Uncharacterized protein n=1 Tax=Collybiopsis luxurians FD-317 M1 TaxID=944289 RepID=A0A0D0BZ86_9AGAR|nr:hypothetical protein GYMLUDRAFT_248823 [Collybiopsis luxurians FD-317 M1]